MNAEKKKKGTVEKEAPGLGATKTVLSIFRCRSGKGDASLREGKGMIHTGPGIRGRLGGRGTDGGTERTRRREREGEQSDQVRRLSDHSSV